MGLGCSPSVRLGPWDKGSVGWALSGPKWKQPKISTLAPSGWKAGDGCEVVRTGSASARASASAVLAELTWKLILTCK